MRKYSFTDSDDFDLNAEFDIDGDDYKNLLLCAEKYCAYFSLDYPFGLTQLDSLVPYVHIIHNIDDYKKSWEKRGISNWYDVRVFYKYNSETKQILEKLSDSIFKFHFHYEGKPENPTFYRKDYSVLFASVTHDGDSFLFPKESEDVSVLLSNEHWRELDV